MTRDHEHRMNVQNIGPAQTPLPAGGHDTRQASRLDKVATWLGSRSRGARVALVVGAAAGLWGVLILKAEVLLA